MYDRKPLIIILYYTGMKLICGKHKQAVIWILFTCSIKRKAVEIHRKNKKEMIFVKGLNQLATVLVPSV
jgi:hypothetical protein